MQVTNFNLRVYGLLIHEGNILITHEHREGLYMTKFPGGGLEKGEGLEDCLKREFLEEMNIEIDVDELFYVNDFLQISSFNPKDQLISFYYKVTAGKASIAKIHDLVKAESVDIKEQRFEWIYLNDLISESFTFPIDKLVVNKLRES